MAVVFTARCPEGCDDATWTQTTRVNNQAVTSDDFVITCRHTTTPASERAA